MVPSTYFKYLFVGLIGFLAGIWFLSGSTSDRILAMESTPCTEPLSYTIGEIDPRFGIDRDGVKQRMETAAEVWSGAMERPMAVHKPGDDADVTVHFVYDERQELVDGELRFRERIKTEQSLLDQMQKEHKQERGEFERRSQEYVQFAERTTEKLDELNEWVKETNEAGGFMPEDVETFDERKSDVEQRQQRVLDERRALDELAAEINREQERINKKIEENNDRIDEYNEEFAGSTRFTKATFQRIGSGGVIRVNQFMTRREISLLLAHELGHAFGLDHVSNPRSIMHSQMGGQQYYPTLELTREDKAAIQNLCN